MRLLIKNSRLLKTRERPINQVMSTRSTVRQQSVNMPVNGAYRNMNDVGMVSSWIMGRGWG